MTSYLISSALLCSIFITHLHGDHCFGLATTLQFIDHAKAASLDLAAPLPVTHVYGPPGLGELLRVSLPADQHEGGLRTKIMVTELVLDREDACELGPLLTWSDDGAATWPLQQQGHTSASRAAPLLTLGRLASHAVSEDPFLQVGRGGVEI